MLPAMLVSTVLVLTTVLIHYEVLRFTSLAMPRIHMPPRQRILVVILAAFLAHTIEVWISVSATCRPSAVRASSPSWRH